MRTVEYELMRPAEIAQARARLPLAFIPIGPLEWHGPHLPMGMDGLHAHTVAMEVARRVGGVVLPTYYLGSETVRPTDRGPQSAAILGFEGTERIIGMDFPDNPVKSLYFEEGTFAVAVRELIRLLKLDGYRLLVLVNGHGAVNHMRALQRLAAEATDPPRVRVLFAMAFLPPEPPFSDPGHAEKVETSIILATRPDLVDPSTPPPKSTPLRDQEFGIADAQVSGPVHFVGVRNFIRLLRTAIFTLTLSNTVWYTLAAVTAKLALGLALALVLAQRAPGMRWIRGAVLIPWVVPTSLAMLAWTWMFDSTYSVINWMLMHVGMISGPIAWLGAPRLARFAVVLVNVWSGLPFFGINFLAGLVTIPQELYEAATVDGAGSLVRFRRVTLPLLRPVLATVLLFSVVMTSSDFATIFVLTKGGPQNTTQILSTLAFKLGLATGDLGNAAAISLYLFPILAISTYVQVRLMRRVWQW